MGLVALVVGAFIGNVVIRGLNRAVFGSGDSGPMRWILLVGAIIAASTTECGALPCSEHGSAASPTATSK